MRLLGQGDRCGTGVLPLVAVVAAVGLAALAQALVDRVDDVRQRDGDGEVEEAREHQRGLVAGVRRGILPDPEQLALVGEEPQEVDERGLLDERDELVHQGREDATHALRDHDESHRLAVREAERARGLGLARIDALDAGAEDFSEEDDSFEILTDPDNFEEVRKALEDAGIPMISAEVTMIPQNYVTLTDETAVKNLQRTLELLEDDDDVQAVYHNWDE